MKRHYRGFTLIEVLIALVILAVALAAAARAANMATSSAEESKLRTLATWVAQNRLALLAATRSFPAPGTSEGKSAMGGLNLAWQQTVSNTPNAGFRKVELLVYRPDGSGTLTTLTAYLVQTGDSP